MTILTAAVQLLTCAFFLGVYYGIWKLTMKFIDWIMTKKS